MGYPAIYEVDVWNEFKGIKEKLHGITFCDNYANAAENIEGYYGESILEMKIELLEENTVFEFEENKDELNKIFPFKATD